jgi:hypothetical protein
MKLLYTIAMVLLINTMASAQPVTITMGAGYANEVYFKLPNTPVKTEPIKNWELAFRIGTQNSSIFINSENSVVLYNAPVDTSEWLTLDTTGLQSWQVLYNSDTSWEVGAFDRNTQQFPDFGWGDYDFTTHIIHGDSLFVLYSMASGYPVYKKIWIVKKDFGVWTIRISDLDNSNDQVLTCNSADYTERNFAYYSIVNNEWLDREPSNTSWDLVFTRYFALQPSMDYYPVTGVLQNTGVLSAQASGVDVSTSDYSSYEFISNISEIGYDWKYFDLNIFSYVMQDSLVYFIQGLDGGIYKIIFTAFDYLAGTIDMEVETMTTGIAPTVAAFSTAAAYPNPATDYVELILAAQKSLNGKLSLYNIHGQQVFETPVQFTEGLQKINISLPPMAPGLYSAVLGNETDFALVKLMITQ